MLDNLKLLCKQHDAVVAVIDTRRSSPFTFYVLECGCERLLDVKPEEEWEPFDKKKAIKIKQIDEVPESFFTVDWWKKDNPFPLNFAQWRFNNNHNFDSAIKYIDPPYTFGKDFIHKDSAASGFNNLKEQYEYSPFESYTREPYKRTETIREEDIQDESE